MNKTPETDDLARGNHVVPTEWAEQLECERDEARRERDAWEKVAILNAEKLGCLLFGKVEGVK